MIDDGHKTNAQAFRTLREPEIFLEQTWKLLNMRLEGYEQECKRWETEFTCLEVEKVATVSELDFVVLVVFPRSPAGSCPQFSSKTSSTNCLRGNAGPVPV